ncbi:MAG: hypothetical protein NTV24_01645 [Candidatus Woesebacteria bacterium]|nr:hypothetical protein [Candidatus Woesebacteria bacterium]
MSESVDKYAHTTQVQGKNPWWAKLLSRELLPESTIISYDNAAVREADRVPPILRHKGYEPPVLEGKFTTDRKGRMHRVR